MQIADTQMTIQRSLGWAINLQYLEIRSIGNFIQKNETGCHAKGASNNFKA